MKKKLNMPGKILSVCACLFWIFLFGAALFGMSARAERDGVEYLVFFVDEQDHARKIFNTQSGKTLEGTEILVEYPDQIIGNDGHFWRAAEKSPQSFLIYQNGVHKYYVEYSRGEMAVKPEAPDHAGSEKLEEWLEKAWWADCAITGRNPEEDRTPYLTVEDDDSNDSRIRNLVSMISDGGWHSFYMIGKNYTPRSLVIGTDFDAEYSSAREDSFQAGGNRYQVFRFSVRRNQEPETCTHQWKLLSRTPEACLSRGREEWRCERCGADETTFLPALDHVDEDGDSLCDRCGRRVFFQETGNVIETELFTRDGVLPLSFTCLDPDYEGTGRMLYLSDQLLGTDVTGSYFATADYNTSPLRRYLNLGFANDSSIKGALRMIGRKDGDGVGDAAILLSEEEYKKYSALGRIPLISEGYFLRTADAGNPGTMRAVSADGRLVSSPPENSEFGARIAVLLDEPVLGEEPEPVRWVKGDVEMRQIGEATYRFRCIDEDYSDGRDGRRKAALFLCDAVIPADVDKSAEMPNAFSFGQDNNYKTSNIRKWLQENGREAHFNMEPVFIGVDTAYTGSTDAGAWAQLSEKDLRRHDIGFQLLQDQLFCLSLEEALKYKSELWRFGGGKNNPETQLRQYSEGYYLRTPYYAQDETGSFCYTKDVYAVDLVNGSLHTVKTGSTTYGLRPAFVLPQQ